MQIHEGKKSEHTGGSATGDLIQKKERTSFYLTDNRPQAKTTAQLQAVANTISSPEQTIQKNNTGLPDDLKTGVENLSGYSMDDVKVHYNSNKPAQLQAHAYAQGTEIHLAAGQEKHLPHEAWHVVQQKQNRVKPTVQLMEKVNVNDDKELEAEASVMGNKAFQFVDNRPAKSGKITKEAPASPITQRVIKIEEPEKNYENVGAAIEAAKPATEGDKTGGIARQHVRNIYKDVEVHTFQTEEIYQEEIARFTEHWMARLDQIGVKPDEHENALNMHNRLGNANPSQDSAILHKLEYRQVLENWKRKTGKGAIADKGLEYRPWGGHKMPLNYSWLASVAQHQVPVQVIVPITERVLIRPQTRKSTAHPVDTDMDAVRSGHHEAPLSATALEILGLLRNDFYRVDTSVESTDMLIRLVPTGKIITDPRQVTAGKSMNYSSLAEELNRYGIKIHPNEVINRIIAELPREELPQMASGGASEDLGNLFNTGPSRNTIMIRQALAVALFALVIGLVTRWLITQKG